MNPTVEQLQTIARSLEFQGIVTNCYSALRTGGSRQHVMQHLMDRLTSKFGLMADTERNHGTTLVLYLTGTRAKQPACLVVSQNSGQMPSPSAQFVFMAGNHMIQLFEGDSDDGGMEGSGTPVAHWVESKGRTLLC